MSCFWALHFLSFCAEKDKHRKKEIQKERERERTRDRKREFCVCACVSARARSGARVFFLGNFGGGFRVRLFLLLLWLVAVFLLSIMGCKY